MNSDVDVFLSLIQVPVSSLILFVDSLEVGYSKHKNPYHNLMHAADVTQTIHYLLLKTGLLVRLLTLLYSLSKVTSTESWLSATEGCWWCLPPLCVPVHRPF